MQASMRIFVGLCLLAVLCTGYAIDSTDDLLAVKLQVKNELLNIDTILQQLERLRIETEEDTLLTVTKRWWNQMDSFRDYVNLLLSAMRREVNAARLKGVNTQDCYDAGFKSINDHSDKAYKSAEKCKDTAETNIKDGLGFIDGLKSNGDTLTEELNNLLLTCHDVDKIKLQICATTELARITAAIKSLQNDVKYAGYTALPASNYAVIQASKCLDNAYLLARYKSDTVLVTNSKCTKNALEKKKYAIA